MARHPIPLLLCASLAALTVLPLSPASAGLFGPGKFTVEQSNDRFSSDGVTTYLGHNNRVSKKSVAGGIHVDDKGMYIEPLATRRKSDGSLVGVGFFIHNETDYDTGWGSPNRIGVPERITFIPNGGHPISAAITNGGSKWGDRNSYNSITNSASSPIQESGFADLSADQFQRIATATTIAVKVEGSERSAVYDERVIAKSFLPNLRTFYASVVTNSSH